MGHEQGRQIGFETLVKHNMTHQDIADLTGTSRQMVTAVLNQLKRSNVLYFNRKRYFSGIWIPCQLLYKISEQFLLHTIEWVLFSGAQKRAAFYINLCIFNGNLPEVRVLISI